MTVSRRGRRLSNERNTHIWVVKLEQREAEKERPSVSELRFIYNRKLRSSNIQTHLCERCSPFIVAHTGIHERITPSIFQSAILLPRSGFFSRFLAALDSGVSEILSFCKNLGYVGLEFLKNP